MGDFESNDSINAEITSEYAMEYIDGMLNDLTNIAIKFGLANTVEILRDTREAISDNELGRRL